MRQTKIGVLSALLLAAAALHPQASDPNIAKLKSEAEAGDATSQVTLGLAYQNGSGVDANDALAVQWYRKAAEAGNSEGQNDLGVMYMHGWGIEKNKEEAIHWYRLAAKQRNSHAMVNLGAAYYNGDGVPIDDAAAYVWLLLAQEAGSTQANDAVQRSGKAPGGPPANAFAQIAEMYENGDGIPADQASALKWLRKAGDAGDLVSDLKIASLLLFKKDASPQDYREGIQRCQQLADLKNPPGVLCLAYIYQRGLGVPANPAEGAKWLTVAAELGHPQAMLDLSTAYWKGNGVKPDTEAAYVWALIALDLKHPQASQQAEMIRKELSDRQVSKAEKKAADWTKQHPFLAHRNTLITR